MAVMHKQDRLMSPELAGMGGVLHSSHHEASSQSKENMRGQLLRPSQG